MTIRIFCYYFIKYCMTLYKELLEQFEELDRMDTEKRNLTKRIISMAINEDKIKKMAS